MRKIMLLLIVFFAFYSNVLSSDSTTTRKELVYYCLQMEKEAGFEVHEEEYILLDSILSVAEKKIKISDTLAKNYPLNILIEIHDILEKSGITGDYNQKDPYKNLLSYSLRTRKFDCDKYSFLFLAIGERLNLPLYAVLLPSHMAIQWSDKKYNFYWETTSKSEKNKEAYINLFHLNKYHFNQRMYLEHLSKEDLKLCFLYNRGLTFFMLGKYQQAEKDLDSSNSLKGIHPFIFEMKGVCKNKIMIKNTSDLMDLPDTNHDSLKLQRAMSLIRLKGNDNYTKALSDLNSISGSSSLQNEVHLWRGIINLNLFTLGKLSKKNKYYKNALTNFNFIIDKDQNNYESNFYRSILNRWARDYNGALTDINTVLNARSTEEAYIEKGNLYYNQKKFQQALDFYNKALEMNPDCIKAIECRGFTKLELEQRDEAAEDFFKAYYTGIMPYEYFKKYSMIRNEY